VGGPQLKRRPFFFQIIVQIVVSLLYAAEYYDALGALSSRGLDATEWLKWFLEQVVAACGESAGGRASAAEGSLLGASCSSNS
jgi:hypothetical protein